MDVLEAADQVLQSHYCPQLIVLATEGYCWFDLLLAELVEITDLPEPVEHLKNFAKCEMATEEWKFVSSMACFGKELIEIENADKLGLTKLMRRTAE